MLKEEIIVSASAEPQKYKYILNGEVFYFTREELKDYMERLYIKNKIPYDDVILETVVDSRIKKILKYNGDPYGGMINQEGRKEAHKMEAEGCIFHIKCFY
jgi:predicted RNA-binding protein with PUA domain